MDALTSRLARRGDLETLRLLMNVAIADLQKPFLTSEQIESSRAIMGLDGQLIDDGTYFVIEIEGTPVGCGGWSKRATLYGNDSTPGRNATLLDPDRDPTRIRAMYTHPDYTRRGIGRLILQLCESAARDAGFSRVELMATRAGEPLYRACGYVAGEALTDSTGGAPVPLLHMGKDL